jgi:hypothetical protein
VTSEGLPAAERPIPPPPPSPPDVPSPLPPISVTTDPHALQILTTEHWSLLSARSLVYNEAFARAGMFLTFLSASLVALALVGQALSFGREFLVLTAAILAADIVLGLATYGRVMAASVEDLRAIHGMNRLRAGYVQIAPSVLPYFVTSVHDDAVGVFGAYGTRGVRLGREALMHGLSTTSGMIGAIVALLVGGLAAVVLLLAGLVALAAIPLGAVVTASVFLTLSNRAARTIKAYEDSIVSLFPSP